MTLPDTRPDSVLGAGHPPAMANPYPAGFRVSTERLGGGALVRVEGSLDRGSAPSVEEEAGRQIDRHGARLVLDLSPTTFIDVAAIHLMETLSARVAAAGGTLIIVLTCPRAHWLLDLVPAHEQLCVVASVEDAMAAWPGQGLAQAG